MAALKVMMIGGRRCGKTSVLASLFAQMQKSPVNNYFTVADITNHQDKGLETQDSLNNKTLELQYMLETNRDSSNIFLVDKSPTHYFWEYKLRLQIPGQPRKMDMEFIDCPGEVFETKGTYAEETAQYIKDCDVFVIAIDTPYLMGSVGEDTKDLCPEAINLGTNRVNDILNFLTNIDNNDGQDAKMVVFVPLKCEKWAKEPGGLERVTARVKEVYETHIKNLSAFAKMYISIIPMQTSGNILFSEFRKAYIYQTIDGIQKRCCRIDDEVIRMEEGGNTILQPGEIIAEDSMAVIAGTNLLRPYAWYQINPQSSEFAPHNCEQLPLHIIRFMLTKLMDAETIVARPTGITIIDIFINAINKIRGWFNNMDPKELKKIISQMQYDGVIKDNGDGIEVIRKF